MANSNQRPVTPPRTKRVTYDRMTLTIYFSIGLWGWFVMSIGPTVPLITKHFDVSKSIGGLHGTAIAIGAISVGLISRRLVLNFGRRPIMLVGAALMVGGSVLLATGPHIAFTIAAAMILSLGGNLIVNTGQPALAVHHRAHGPAAVTEANAVAAVAGVLGPLAVGAAVAIGWGWRPAILIITVLSVTSFLLITRLPTEDSLDGRAVTRPQAADVASAAGAEVATAQKPAAKRSGYQPAFWFFVVGLTAGVSVELSTGFWAADLIGTRTGVGDGIATAALAALFGGMATARIIGGQLALRYAPEKLMILGFGIAGAGWLAMWTSTSTGIAIAALFLTGTGFGLHYPLGVALIIKASENRPDAAQAIASIAAGIAAGVAPFVLGALADQFGSHRAFTLVPAIMILGAGSVYLGLRQVHKRIRFEAQLR